MLECSDALHADFSHHGLGLFINQRRHRIDPLQAEVFEAMAEAAGGSFGCKALSPGGGMEPPADVDAGCEVGFEIFGEQSDETDEAAGLEQVDGIVAKAFFGLVLLHAGDKGFSFCPRLKGGKELHDPGVGAHFCEDVGI